MTTITGTIKEIENTTNAGHVKKTVTLRINHLETAFVQFHGTKVNLLKNFKVGDEVEITYKHNAKKAPSGMHHQNNDAVSIKTHDICLTNKIEHI